jgi:hypothetical protein
MVAGSPLTSYENDARELKQLPALFKTASQDSERQTGA